MHEKAKSGFKTILSAMELGQTGDTSGDIHITAKYKLVEKNSLWLWTDQEKLLFKVFVHRRNHELGWLE